VGILVDIHKNIQKCVKCFLATFFVCEMEVRSVDRRGGEKFLKLGSVFLENFHLFFGNLSEDMINYRRRRQILEVLKEK
jgi:hypothetical protein